MSIEANRVNAGRATCADVRKKQEEGKYVTEHFSTTLAQYYLYSIKSQGEKKSECFFSVYVIFINVQMLVII